MSVRRPVLAAALAGAILFATPLATASAQTNVHRDPSGDVAAVDLETGTTTPQPDVAAGDIVASSASYTRHALYASESFRKLPSGDDVAIHVFQIGGSNGVLEEISVLVSSGHSAQEYERGNHHAPKRCHGLTHYVDYAAKRVSIRVPRSCLRSAAKVHVASGTIRATDASAGSDDDVLYLDDARSTGVRSDGNLRWTPWLRRG